MKFFLVSMLTFHCHNLNQIFNKKNEIEKMKGKWNDFKQNLLINPNIKFIENISTKHEDYKKLKELFSNLDSNIFNKLVTTINELFIYFNYECSFIRSLEIRNLKDYQEIIIGARKEYFETTEYISKDVFDNLNFTKRQFFSQYIVNVLNDDKYKSRSYLEICNHRKVCYQNIEGNSVNFKLNDDDRKLTIIKIGDKNMDSVIMRSMIEFYNDLDDDAYLNLQKYINLKFLAFYCSFDTKEEQDSSLDKEFL